jgi:hypothetical protein
LFASVFSSPGGDQEANSDLLVVCMKDFNIGGQLRRSWDTVCRFH